MNCKLLKFCWVIVLLIFFNSCLFAQNSQAATDSASVSAEPDSINNNEENKADTLVVKTLFSDTRDSVQEWKRNREFGYMAYLDSLLRKKKGLRIDTVSINKGMVSRRGATTDPATGDSSNSFLNSFPVRVFFWAVAIFFIGFILYKLFFAGGLFTKGNAKAGDEPVNDEPERLNEYSEYNVFIHEAELKSDFNLSIRYLYLQTLKKLVDNEVIAFSADKTNDRYVKELANLSYQQEFAFLTRNYDYVWYGKFPIELAHYQKLKTEFIAFNKKI